MEGSRGAEQPERSRRPEEPEMLRTLRKFVSTVLGTNYRQEVFHQLTNLFHAFNRNRFAIREQQIKVWSDSDIGLVLLRILDQVLDSPSVYGL